MANPAEDQGQRGVASSTRLRSPVEVFVVFLRLGLTSFGGPVAHLGYMRREFVERRRWLSEAAFTDILALCQFLPGPASSQTGFAIGLREAGWAGGLAAFAGFTAPSAILMFAAAFGLVVLPPAIAGPAFHGLVLVAVPVVTHALVGMARASCRQWQAAILAIAAAVVLLAFHQPWLQPAVIAIGALAGLVLVNRSSPIASDLTAPPAPTYAPLAIVTFVVLLAGLPLLAAVWPAPAVQVADSFYRSGALVFGGGHVVLPLLQAETTGHGWLDQQSFLAGYGAAQALPGPLFTFAAYLGAAGHTGLQPVAGGALALFAVFLPGLLLVAGLLPVWSALKKRPWAIGLIGGANAAVVGVLGAALYDPVFVSAMRAPWDAVIALAGFAALQALKAPNWLVVIGVSVAGALLYSAAG